MGALSEPELVSLLDRIETADALDVLCVVARNPAGVWSLSEIATRVAMADSELRTAVLHLRGRGLIIGTNSESIGLAVGDAPLMSAAGELLNAYVHDREKLLELLAGRAIERRRDAATQRLARMSRSSDDDT
jgi:DNA-binding IclR family transcriptional regulator